MTSGYIIPSMPEGEFALSHFDVIIYDRLNSPVLWSEHGGARAVPAEHVFCVIEIKSSITAKTFKDALAKLSELDSLLMGTDQPDERYEKYLPTHFTSLCVFSNSIKRVDFG